MIDITAIGDEGIEQTCPHCRVALLKIFAHRAEVTFKTGALYHDGDTIPVFHELTNAQRTGGWYTSLLSGACPFCKGGIICIDMIFLEATPDEEFRDVYFYRNGERGEETNFLATSGGEMWDISRFDTPLGPMLEHHFGPFADNYGDWIGPNGVAMCKGGGPWDFARQFVLQRWDELQAMPKALR